MFLPFKDLTFGGVADFLKREFGDVTTEQNTWQSDSFLREAVGAPAAQGPFVANMAKFFAALDEFNAGKPKYQQLALVLNTSMAAQLEKTFQRDEPLSMKYLGGFGLQRNGEVFIGHYQERRASSVMVFNGAQTKAEFYFSRAGVREFEVFGKKLGTVQSPAAKLDYAN